MSRERLDKWCERGITGLTVVVLIFAPLATGAVRPVEFLVVQGLTAAATLLWLFRLWIGPNHQRLLWPPICWAVLGFVIYAVVRYQHADLEYVARQELIRILVYALLFFIILNNLARQESAQVVSFTLVFLGMAISIYAIYQFAAKSQYVWHFIRPIAYEGRGSGTYICPNHLAGFLEMLLPLGLAYTLTGRIPHLLRVFLGYASAVILAGIVVTISRGAWAATGLALFLFFIVLVRKPKYRIPALVFIILVAAGATIFYSKSQSSQHRIDRMFAGDSPHSVGIRLWLWQPAVQMWQNHFWFGVGPAHFDYRFPAYRPPEVQHRPGRTHNDYLNTLADWGVVGTTLVAASWVMLFAGIFKTWKYVSREQSDLRTKLSNRSAFVLGASLGLVAILVHSFTDFNMHIPANALLAVALMALLSAQLRFATERYWVPRTLLLRCVVTAGGLTAIVYFVHQGAVRSREHAWLEKAAAEKVYSPALANLLKKAAVIEPNNAETTYAIGEAYRQMSWQGGPDYEALAREAIQWFESGIRLNPYDSYNYMKLGMCLDWLGRPEKAAPYFEQTMRLDPNNYYVIAHYGWHFFQIGDYATAKRWFTRSTELHHAWQNPIARTYLEIIERKLKEATPPK